MGNIGVSGLIIILVIALVLFGPSKLPELGRAFGRTLREFKEGTRELIKDEIEDAKGSREAVTSSTKPAEAEETPTPPAANQDKRLPD